MSDTEIYPAAELSDEVRSRARDLVERTGLGRLQATATAMMIEEPDVTRGEIADRLDLAESSVRHSLSLARDRYDEAEYLIMSVGPGVFERGPGGSPTHGELDE